MNGLYALKPWYTRRLGGVLAHAVRARITPDAFTAVGVLGAGLAAAAVAAGWWAPAAAALAMRLAGANLDGAVARARGVSRPWGFVANEIGDRLSDVLMFGGLAVLASRTGGGWDRLPVLLVVVAALAATLPTTASLAAAGAGAPRRNGGPLGKTERCALVVLATAMPGWIAPVAVVIISGSILTAATRLRAAHGELCAPR